MSAFVSRASVSAGALRRLLGSAVMVLAASAQAGDGAATQLPSAGASAVSANVAQTVWGILGYTRWPDSAPVLQLCIAGDTPHAVLLLAGSVLSNGRQVQTRLVHLDSAQPLLGCHALYAGRLGTGQWQQLMTAWPKGQALLTVSEEQATCHQGGMFCLNITSSAPYAVSFELNLDSVARSGVRLNPRVLGLARRKDGN